MRCLSLWEDSNLLGRYIPIFKNQLKRRSAVQVSCLSALVPPLPKRVWMTPNLSLNLPQPTPSNQPVYSSKLIKEGARGEGSYREKERGMLKKHHKNPPLGVAMRSEGAGKVGADRIWEGRAASGRTCWLFSTLSPISWGTLVKGDGVV